MVSNIVKAIIFAVVITSAVEATFSTGFRLFLTLRYGQAFERQLSRLDFGVNGSFGGGPLPTAILTRDTPIIIVHGMNDVAETMAPIRDFFVKQGYSNESIFATTYGPNGTIVNANQEISCSYMQQVRNMIIAANAYAGRPVIVTGYSLGVPVVRKAILGGICLDTGENLGAPLTKLVSVFLSNAGANQGAIECEDFPTFAACNNVTGAIVGSEFLDDINSKIGYEGKKTYYVRSSTDDVVGYEFDGIFLASLAGSLVNVTVANFTHVDTCFNTLHIQYSLLTTGKVSQATINADTSAESDLTGLDCSGFAIGPNKTKVNNNGENDSSDYGDYNSRNNTFTFFNGNIYIHRLRPCHDHFFTDFD